MEAKETKTIKAVFLITQRGDKSYWTRIGTGYVNRDNSITLRLDAVPVGTSQLQIRDITPRDEAHAEVSGRRNNEQPASNLDDDIPNFA